MSATNGVAVLDRVRAALTEAQEKGAPTPGRPTLVKLTGASDHQVRRALEILANPGEELVNARDTSPPAPRQPAENQPVETRQPHDLANASPPAGASVATPGEPLAGGSLVAWLGFVFGSAMSVAANVLHTWLPASHMPAGWWPGLAPQIGAAVWPIALLISVEVLSRVRWKPGILWGLTRYGGAGTVAIGSGVISYGHLREVLLAWGYGSPGSDVGPLVLDGLMVVSGFALLAMAGGPAGDTTASDARRAPAGV